MGEETTNSPKLSYEELEEYARQLAQANVQMRQHLEQQNYGNYHQRIAYLFEVVRNSDKFSAKFVANCITELEEILTLPEEDKPNKE